MNLEIFRFENQEVRFVGTPENPWWVAADVCTILEIDTTQTRRLDEDEKGLRLMQTLGGNQEILCINESGLYSLVLGSRKPQARRFKKWITSVVLPAIRKTGSYSIDSRNNLQLEIIDRLFSRMEEFGISAQMVESAKLEAIAKTYPQFRQAADTAKQLLAAKTVIEELPMSATELGAAIALLLNLEHPISANKVNKALLEAGLQEVRYRRSSKGQTKRDGYTLTEYGRKYGQIEQMSARNSEGQVYRVRWFKSVINLLEKFFN